MADLQTDQLTIERVSIAKTAATDTNIVVIAAAHTRSNSCLSHW